MTLGGYLFQEIERSGFVQEGGSLSYGRKWPVKVRGIQAGRKCGSCEIKGMGIRRWIGGRRCGVWGKNKWKKNAKVGDTKSGHFHPRRRSGTDSAGMKREKGGGFRN